MFDWWKKPVRSSKEGERLTDWECKKIAKTLKCPDCGGALKKGPEGGCSVNVCCIQCFSEFNITIWDGSCMGERISDVGPRDVGDRAWAYQLKQKV